MTHRTILLIGGTGFIGSHIAAQLNGASARRVIVPTRRITHGRHLWLLPTVRVVEDNIHDDATLARLMQGVDAVINLVGVLHSRPARGGAAYGPDFARAHVELPQRIVDACAAAGVKRYLHMSALGASPDGPSMYLRSKAAGEAAAMSRPEVATTIFRPSVVFGREDRFLNLFASMQKLFPVMPLGGATAKFQPVYVNDVAQAFCNAIDEPRTYGKTYDLAGPEIYTLKELVQLAGAYAGHARPVLALPPAAARMQAWVLEHLPGQLMSRDNLDSMKRDNVASGPIAPELRVTPTAIDAIAPHYLGQRNDQARYDEWRGRARR